MTPNDTATANSSAQSGDRSFERGITTGFLEATRAGYDAVAAGYADKFFNELAAKPLDRELLARLVAAVGELGPICDMGCGPGQIARHLKDRGAQVLGVDLSPALIAEAHRLNPDIEFHTGNMLALDLPDGSLGGIAAFYSIIHLPRNRIPDALQEFWRVLRPGGHLLLAFHVGDEIIHRDNWWEKPVSLDFHLLQPYQIAAALRQIGFTIEESLVRQPYASEHPSRRAYLLARRI